LIQAVWGSGHEGAGLLKIVANSPNVVLSPEHLNMDVTGQVLAIGSLNSLELFHRAEDLGVRGLIVGSASAELCRASRESPLPLIVTDGVGGGGMASSIFQLLQRADGRSVSLFGSYSIEAGQRPEIILPQAAALGLDAVKVKKALEPGQLVRILGKTKAAQVGTVKYIYNRLQPTAVGMKVPGADVELPDGQTMFVPIANLDVIA
jgi:hypothetical protein